MTVFRNTVSSPIVVLSLNADSGKALRLATQDYNEYADESAGILAPGIEAQLKSRPQKKDRSSRNIGHPTYRRADFHLSHPGSNADMSRNPRMSATGLQKKHGLSRRLVLQAQRHLARSVPHSLLHSDAHAESHYHFSEDTRMSSGLYQPPEFSVFLGQPKSPEIPQFAKRSGQAYNTNTRLRSGRQAVPGGRRAGCWSGKACGADVIPSPSQYMAQTMAQIANPKKSRVARSRLFRGVMYGDARSQHS